jgi:hypothetical protein
MALSSEHRDALPDGDFAVPSKRKLPMPDERHVRLAWSQLARTGGLSSAERLDARARIMARAETLGMDTSDFDTVKAMRFEVDSLDAMAIDIPHVDDHPNRMPFSGIMTRIDRPSDAAPHGANGKRVTITRAAAEKALSSILGMAVDFTPSFDGHDRKQKIGLITAATIQDDPLDGDFIRIEGFLYAADFPQEAAQIQTDKDLLGFSWEIAQVHVESLDTNPLAITDCVFTGAAILLKDKAAYTSTSLAAAADKDIEMTPEELKEILAAALKPVTDELAEVKASQAKIDAERAESAAVVAKVEPHAKALEAAAVAMEADGVGDASLLRRQAAAMRAEAAQGRLPTGFSGTVQASAAPAADTAAIDAATKPLTDQIAALGTQIADLKAASAQTATPPVRKTLEPAITSLLAKAGVTAPEGDAKITTALLDKALAASGLDVRRA